MEDPLIDNDFLASIWNKRATFLPQIYSICYVKFRWVIFGSLATVFLFYEARLYFEAYYFIMYVYVSNI